MPASRVRVPDLLLALTMAYYPTADDGSAVPQENSFACTACGHSRS
ncbi:hypothetical protein [Streptomyces sp. NPDC057428]